MNDAKHYLWRGINYYYLKKYSLAIADLNIVIQKDTKIELAYYYRALLRYFELDDKGVIEDCNKALELKKNASTYYQRGISKYNLKDYQGALDDFNESLKINPEYKLAILERGVTSYQLEKDNAALTDLNKYIELDPNSSRAFYYRGKLKKYMNDLTGSCTDLKKAQALGDIYAKEELVKNGCK